MARRPLSRLLPGLLSCGLLVAGPAGAARIVDVRVGQHPGFTRVVFQLDGSATHSIEPIATGSREILVTLGADGELRNLSSTSPLLGGVRMSPGPAGTVAHLDLLVPNVRVREMVLREPDRIVLDLRPADPGVESAVQPRIEPQAEQAVGGQTLQQELAGEREARSRLEVEVAQLRTMVEGLREDRKAADTEVQGLRSSVNELEERTGPPSGAAGSAVPGREVGIDKEKAREMQRAERVILEERRGVLLPAGQLVVEPGVEYSTLSRSRVQISGFSLVPSLVIGTIDVVDVERDIYRGFVTSRYGISDWLEAELTVPWVKRNDEEIFGSRGNEESVSASGDGLGDITGGLFTELLRERGSWPSTVLNLRFSAPTGQDFSEVDIDSTGRATELPVGTGFWGFSAGTTFVKTTDPAVLFGSLSYYWNLEDDKSTFGTIDPGDSFEYSAGLALALNEKMAFSVTHQHRITTRTKRDGEELLHSDFNAASLFFGLSYTLNQWTALSFNVGVGVTEDAPDVTLELRVPLRMPFRLPVLKMPSVPWRRPREDRTVLLDGSGVPAGGAPRPSTDHL